MPEPDFEGGSIDLLMGSPALSAKVFRFFSSGSLSRPCNQPLHQTFRPIQPSNKIHTGCAQFVFGGWQSQFGGQLRACVALRFGYFH